ncbi:MAG: hypothetical protein EZS28_008678 [Streblomastix strix]|uniref:Peptidase C14 caspase domain-containing protein n=1 Tax=Streblomastix strix TaxID=222440 RepID=A0A5J4WLT7_9EUKA|nr:MAG: hypothetical protein EZS28_008678 [Streblomastix strix]
MRRGFETQPPPAPGYVPPAQGYVPPAQGYPGYAAPPPAPGYAAPPGYAPPQQAYPGYAPPPAPGYAPPAQGYVPPQQGYPGYAPPPGPTGYAQPPAPGYQAPTGYQAPVGYQPPSQGYQAPQGYPYAQGYQPPQYAYPTPPAVEYIPPPAVGYVPPPSMGYVPPSPGRSSPTASARQSQQQEAVGPTLKRRRQKKQFNGYEPGKPPKPEDRIQEFSLPIEVFQGPTVYDASVDENDWVPSTSLPAQFVHSEAEIQEQKKRWATFAAFMSKPFEYPSKFKKQLQELDQLGCINLKRATREQIPGLEINYAAVLFFNTYEGLPHALDAGPVNDALILGRVFVEKKYRVFYFMDATPQEFIRWMDWLLENVELELISYFSGHGTNIQDKTGDDKGTLTEVLAFYNNNTKLGQKRGPKLNAVEGITEETISDDVIHDLVINKEYPQTRIVLITDSIRSANVFTTAAVRNLKVKKLPPGVVYIGADQEEQQSGVKDSWFANGFAQHVRQRHGITFDELKAALSQGIKKQFSIDTAVSSPELGRSPVIVQIESNDAEIQLHEITPLLEGKPISAIVAIPPVDVPSVIEIEAAKNHWKIFTSELSKPAPYDSKYKTSYQKLDGMGCINLERITREQIPQNVTINKCAALFFNPYEDLPHTLEAGPVNDGILMAELFLGRGYNVVYLADATPHEYYKWMDWLLENVETELVSFFSGHGTQIPDKTGKEKDGLTEVLVFYNSKKKKSAGKITPVKGVTDETVEDTTMHDLIISKDYPQTRIVLLTDCCHSGTMFNFDQPLPANGKKNSPDTKRINVVCVGAACDNQTAKQVVQGGLESGIFTYNFTQLEKSNPKMTFKELEDTLKKKIEKYQTIQLTASDTKNFTYPIVSDS